MEITKNEEVKRKLDDISGVGKLLFDVDDKYYVLYTHFTVCEAKDSGLLRNAIRYYNEMNKAYLIDLWDEENEILLLKSMHKITVYLDEWDATPDDTSKIIDSFNEDQLLQLEQQIDIYAKIRELYRKYKSWR